jgi:hypothetical protein
MKAIIKLQRNTALRFGLVSVTSFALAASGLRAAGNAPDLDGDGIPNIVDPDIDNDGIPNAIDDNVDGGIAKSGPYAGKYIGDHLANDNPAERDIDGDGQGDDSLGETDIDGDGFNDDDASEADIDGDGRNDDDANERDIDGDGRMDDQTSEDDIDGDGLDDDDASETDIDGDGSDDDIDDDIDGDDLGNGDEMENDTDGDSLSDDDPSDRNIDGDSLDNRDDSDDDNDLITDEDDLDYRGYDDEMEIEISLARVAAPNGSRVRAKLQQLATGKVRVEFDGRADMGTMPEGAYDLVVNGTIIGQLMLRPDGDRIEGEVQFETNPNKPDEIALLIDVVGQPVEVIRDGVVYFSDMLPTPADPPLGGDDGDDGIEDNIKVTLDNAPGLSSEIKAKIEVQFGIAGIVGLEIEVENAPPGGYDVVIGGLSRGILTVEGEIGDSEGQLHFDDEGNGGDELLLDFNAAGQSVALVLDGAVLFSGILPASGS